MKKLKNLSGADTGFTLIELLIVIVIIGILAAVMLVVINPTRIQNRAKNAAIKSTLNKMGFALNGARAAMGSLPVNANVLNEFENTTASACTGTTGLDCQFIHNGVDLPATCSTVYYMGSGTSQCRFRLLGIGNLEDGVFRFVAKKYKLSASEPEEVYIFDSVRGILSCPISITAAQIAGTLPTTCVAE